VHISGDKNALALMHRRKPYRPCNVASAVKGEFNFVIPAADTAREVKGDGAEGGFYALNIAGSVHGELGIAEFLALPPHHAIRVSQ
jgi:hypothetical protein